MRYSKLTTTMAMAAGLGAGFSARAEAACCPDVGHSPAATTGLGAAHPEATNLSAVPTLNVYAFTRDGIRYLQINDATGDVRTAIGWIDSTRWVMPVGSDADQTFIRKAGASDDGTVVYDGDDLKVLLQTLPQGGRTWLVIPKQ